MTSVEDFYDRYAQDEWERLKVARMEFGVMLHALAEYLPHPPSSVLDVGGGPGRYAIALAQQGYEVTLVDLSRQNLELARRKAQTYEVALAGYIHGNVLNLTHFPKEHFDAMLLLGPLYHLLTREERQKALCEALRVLKPGGLIAASFINRYVLIRAIARDQPMRLIEEREALEAFLAEGILYGRPNGSFREFTDAYFALPHEIRPLLEESGFETLTVLSCQGVIHLIEDRIHQLTGEHWQAWVEMNYRLGKDPSVHGAAGHLLYIGRKARGSSRPSADDSSCH
jgi:ubiquinone/menaquinone biosynthesis C-methylase UbiE